MKEKMTNWIEDWLNAVDEQGQKLGWKDYKAYRAHAINSSDISDNDRQDILEYLENHEGM